MIKNPYEVLGVSATARVDECKTVYRKLCRQYHPDNGGDKDRFDEINKAWLMIESGESKIFQEMAKPKNKLRHKTLFTYEVV